MKTLRDISVQYIKGVGPSRKKMLLRLGIDSVEDLLYFFPRRYEDRRAMTPIGALKVGEWQTVCGRVLLQGGRRSWYTKKHLTEVLLEDATGRLVCVWFNQPFIEKYFHHGERAVCYGKVDLYKNRLQMVAPEYEIIEEDPGESLSTGRIVPVYPLTRGVTQRFLRKITRVALDKYKGDLVDELPVSLRNTHRLSNIKRSLENIHFPSSYEEQENALKRISFEEFFFFQISVLLRRLSLVQKEGVAHRISDADMMRYCEAFPFSLTRAQKRVIGEIRSGMQEKAPMLRLLQGDVGSGKTIVALFGCYAAYLNGCQSAFMAPTEILARQHYDTFKKFADKGPFGKMKAALLTSSIPPKEKKAICAQVEQGTIDILIGTHALITEEITFRKLSYAIIDEQHKFGVRQRALLAEKGQNPDVLIMTATPIPRTLCITLYGDLDLSVLDEMPPGRGKVETRMYSSDDTKKLYALIRENVRRGRQVYVVYPIIEESETLDLKAAEAMFRVFKDEVFPELRVGLLHGRMKPKESAEVMERFQARGLDILVATTVLEVGVDVPNASVMIVEHAERFGLSQLHQLRGRIGRGEDDALFIVVSDEESPENNARLKTILGTNDGFKIAEADLMIRGPGRFFGRHQHGLNELKVVNPVTQIAVLELARREAQALLKDDPDLKEGAHPRIKDLITQRYPTYLSMVSAG